MANVIVVGAQWGDEGKAKIVDLLAERADVVVRCQGGCNAGHTVAHNGEVFKFHLIPSGLLYGDKICVIGPGTVIAASVLVQEIEEMQSKGYSTDNLKVSNRAHLTLPFHITLDQAQEAARSRGGKIGTTGRGIGPTYMDKVGRTGLRLGDLYESETVLRNRLEEIVFLKQGLMANVYNAPMETVDELYAYCREYAEKLAPYITDTVPLLHDAVVSGRHILFEGAQGTLLDIDYGTYPFVTSSNATAGGACTGSGIGPTRIDKVIGVMKAYTTRVGGGPFPTELDDDIGKHFQEVGQEFGTTTGRLRRCGWFDAVIARYSVQVNGLDGVAITKLDVLDGLDEIRICTAYRDRETGETVTQFPSQLSRLDRVDPVYETLPGWKGTVSKARRYDDLPAEAQGYLQRLSALIGTEVAIVSVGPDRGETIMVNDPMGGAAGGVNAKGQPSLSSLI